MEPGMLVQKLRNVISSVRTAAVPEQHDRAPNLLEQMIEKLHHLGGADILLGVESAEQPEPSGFRGHHNAGNCGNLRP
jgi:hypothetical protein